MQLNSHSLVFLYCLGRSYRIRRINLAANSAENITVWIIIILFMTPSLPNDLQIRLMQWKTHRDTYGNISNLFVLVCEIESVKNTDWGSRHGAGSP